MEHLRGLVVHRFSYCHDIIHVEGHVLGPYRPADESTDDIEEHVLLKILGPVNLESFLLVNDDGQDSGEHVFNPFVSRAEVEAEHFDDAIGILGPVYCFPTSADDSSDSAAFRSVIDDLATATRRHTAPCLFAIAKCREQAKVDYSVLSSAEHGARFSGWMKAYGALPASEKAMWEMKRRSHLAMQPYIRDVIVDALIRNPRESWRELEVDVNFWCSYSAIRRWIMSREGFRYYAKRIIPLLTTHQMEKHLAFARKFRNNWGLGGGKFLLVMFDEKWFWGLVLRSHAKQVAELGIDPRSFSAYHRNHINKCMVVAVTALAFIDSIENGGIAFKLGLFRAQAHKIARQMVREAVRQAGRW